MFGRQRRCKEAQIGRRTQRRRWRRRDARLRRLAPARSVVEEAVP